MSGQATLVVCADDFGLTDAISATIVALLDAGALNAASCMVERPGWTRHVAELRRLADERADVAVGLHLDLPTPWVSQPFAAGAFQRQWRAFEADFGRPPDFVDGHRHVHLFPSPRAALMRLLSQETARPWLRQCGTRSRRLEVKRLVLDPLSARFALAARRGGHRVNPGFGGLRRFAVSEDVLALWRADIEAMAADGGLLMTHPGAPDRDDPLSACRAQEAALLSGGALAEFLGSRGLKLGAARTAWAEPAAGELAPLRFRPQQGPADRPLDVTARG